MAQLEIARSGDIDQYQSLAQDNAKMNKILRLGPSSTEMTKGSQQNPHVRHTQRTGREWVMITILLLIAALLRFHNLGDIPKGLEHDEVATWHMVTGVLEGQAPIYFEEGYGHEPLYNYMTAISMSIWGDNWLGERFWAPWFGLLAVAATYALMRRLFSPLVGLGAAGFQTTILWAMFFNRLGLRLNLLPFLLTLAVYCFWRGLERLDEKSRRGWIWFGTAGIWAGWCFYTYMSSIVVLPFLATFMAYLILQEYLARKSGRDWKIAARSQPWSIAATFKHWWSVLITLLVAGLVMLPLVHYRLNRPEDTVTPKREGQVDMPLRELLAGNPKPILDNAWALIKMWNVRGELYWQLNYGDRPVFVDFLSGFLFWAGLLVALWRWRDPRMGLILLWTAWGIVPSLITSEAPSWPRTMLASPAALTLPALAVWAAVERLRHCPIRFFRDAGFCKMAEWLVIALLGFTVLLNAGLTYRDYLIRWPVHPRVRYAFQSSLTEALRALDAAPDTTPVTAAGLSPHDMDPWTEGCTLQRRDLGLRWVDTRSALLVPGTDTMRLMTLDITPVDPTLYEWAALAQAEKEQGPWVPRGGRENEPDAQIYWDPAHTIYALNAAALRDQVQLRQVFVGENALEPYALPQAPEFGGLVRLVSYQWLDDPSPGGVARLLTFWAILERGPNSTIYGEPSLKIFVHLLDRQQQMAAGVDLLGAAPDTWHTGDLLVQLHPLILPTQAGIYAVEMGWYTPPDGPRLTVKNVDAPHNRVLLDPLEIP